MEGGATIMSVVKKSISLPDETYVQIDALRKVLHIPQTVPFSTALQVIIGEFYWQKILVPDMDDGDFII